MRNHMGKIPAFFRFATCSPARLGDSSCRIPDDGRARDRCVNCS